MIHIHFCFSVRVSAGCMFLTIMHTVGLSQLHCSHICLFIVSSHCLFSSCLTIQMLYEHHHFCSNPGYFIISSFAPTVEKLSYTGFTQVLRFCESCNTFNRGILKRCSVILITIFSLVDVVEYLYVCVGRVQLLVVFRSAFPSIVLVLFNRTRCSAQLGSKEAKLPLFSVVVQLVLHGSF